MGGTILCLVTVIMPLGRHNWIKKSWDWLDRTYVGLLLTEKGKSRISMCIKIEANCERININKLVMQMPLASHANFDKPTMVVLNSSSYNLFSLT